MSPTAQIDSIVEFLKLIDKTALPEERKLYWMHKIGDGDFTEANERELAGELEEQIVRLEHAIEYTEGETALLEEQLEALKKKVLPELQAFVKAQPKMLEEAGNNYKNSIMEAEKEMFGELEGIRAEGESSAIEDIRKRLGNK